MDLDQIQIEERMNEIYEILKFGYPSNVLSSILKNELEYWCVVLERKAAQECLENDDE